MSARFGSRRPSPTIAVAFVALFVALGGSSYAAVALTRNSVQSKHIQNGQVKRPDLAKGAVNSDKVADGALQAKDFAAGQLPAGPAGKEGAPGPQGPQGPRGDDGADGAVFAAQTRCDDCPVESGDALSPVSVTLTDAEWTQATNEANSIFFEATWSAPPASCTAAGGQQAGGRLQILLDGEVVVWSELPAGFSGPVQPTSFRYLFAPDADTPHTITAKIGDNCTGSENAAVDEIKVDVLGLLG